MSWNSFSWLLNCWVTFSRFAKSLKPRHHSWVFNIYHEVPLHFQILISELSSSDTTFFSQSCYFREEGFPNYSLLAECKQTKLGKFSARWNTPPSLYLWAEEEIGLEVCTTCDFDLIWSTRCLCLLYKIYMELCIVVIGNTRKIATYIHKLAYEADQLALWASTIRNFLPLKHI